MSYIIKGNLYEWECVIGLEIHAQISSNSKLFSGASTNYGAASNSQVSLLDASMPGMLPVLNEFCVKQAIKTGIGIGARINKISYFDRKTYFYPDLPQGYQITQFYTPIVEEGFLMIRLENGEEKKIRINRIHLEQDAGKSMHDQSPNYSFIDLNRSGIALMEIVSEPDMNSPHEAAEYIKKLRAMMRYIGSCDGNMEQGSLRCDANISVRKKGDTTLGTRCEIKNVNSIRNVVKAIEYEAIRQIEILESGNQIDQETRLFDANSGTTRAMRSKENANDYRYFPDPDLLSVSVEEELINELKASMPELPDEKISRYTTKLGLSNYDAEVIVSDDEVAKYFEEAASDDVSPKLIANWISSELLGYLNKQGLGISGCKITPSMLKDMVKLIEKDIISGKIAKKIFEIMAETGKNPESIVEEEGLVQVVDTSYIEGLIDEVIANNPESVEEYLSGKHKLLGFFVGQIMKKTEGKASPTIVNDLLLKKLNK